MKRYELSQPERRKLSGDTGSLAESIAADQYGFNRFVDAEWYDGRRGSGAVFEVKSALSELETSRSGRFRLWETQHSKLAEEDRSGSARYVFVLFDVGQRRPVARMSARRPADVGRSIAARGGFYASGHSSKGRQYKLPIEAVFA